MRRSIVRKALTTILAGAILALGARSLEAQVTTSWTGTLGDWSTASNWDNGEPTSSDTACISNNGIANVTSSGEQCRSLNLGGTAGTGRVQMTGGDLYARYQYVGSEGAGEFTQSGGGLYAPNQYVGYDGTGEFTQSGGANTTSDYYGANGSAPALSLGFYLGSSGAYTLSGGSLWALSVDIGNSGAGTFTQSGGTHTTSALCLAIDSSASGTYNLSGSGQLSGGSEYVGYSGTGTFTQSGGTNTITVSQYYDGLFLGKNAGASGTYNLSDSGRLSTNATEHVGYSGIGAFTQSGGTNTTSALYLAEGSSGTYNLSDSGQLWAGNEYVGSSGSGTFTHSGGTNTTGVLYLGNGSGASGTYNLSDGELSVSGTECIGNSGSGVFNHSGGANNISGSLYLGAKNGSGTYNLSGPGQLSADSEYITSGSFTQSAGTNTIANTLDVGGMYTLKGSGALVVSPSGQIRVSSGGRFEWLYVDGLTSPNLTLQGGILAIGFDFDMADLTGGAPFHGTVVNGLSGLEVTNGATATQAGSTSVTLGWLTVGSNAGGGTYNLIGTGQLSARNEYIGSSGTGTFTQSGGANSISNTWSHNSVLYLGGASGSSGTYNLSDGELSVSGTEYIGYSGTGTFTQSGGTHTSTPAGIGYAWCDGIYLGYNSGATGTYNLTGSGRVLAFNEYIGYSGTGIFTQSGGTNTIQNAENGGGLYLGCNPGASGVYSLSGSAQLSAINEYVGYLGSATFTQSGGINSANAEYLGYTLFGTGTYTQSGGTNIAAFVSVNSVSRYELSGGTLQVSGGFENYGTLDCGNGTGAINASNNTIVNLPNVGTVVHAGSTSLTIGANSLLIVPPGFNLGSVFAPTSQNVGLTHTAGTPLVVASGTGFAGWGSIDDPVDCQGTIAASASGFINLNGGLTVSGTGCVNLGGGYLLTEGASSGISNAGQLNASDEFVGFLGTGTFSQSGGTNGVSKYLYLGYVAGASGTYNLTGTGVLNGTLVVGYSGNGTFTQSGGSVAKQLYLWLGYDGAAMGTYTLSGGSLTTLNEYIGYSGTGIFTQSGGTNSIPYYHPADGGLHLGSRGTYNLNGGLLLIGARINGDGAATFNFGGGTLQATSSFTTTVPIAINAGGATIDTGGFNVTINGDLVASGSLSKEGLGMLALGGSLSMTDSGGLLVNSGSMTAMSIVGSDSTITVGVNDSQTATLAVNYIRAHKLVLEPGSVVILGGVSAAAAAVDPGENVASSYAVGPAGVSTATVPEPSPLPFSAAGPPAFLRTLGGGESGRRKPSRPRHQQRCARAVDRECCLSGEVPPRS